MINSKTSLIIFFLGFILWTGFSPQIALPTFQGAQASGQSDTESPVITITASDGSNAIASNSITNDANITLTFTANENVTGFAVGDIGAIGGSLSSFSGSNATYTSTFTPSSNRNTVVYIPKEVYTDASGNNNVNSIPFYWTYDGTLPVYLSGTYVTADNGKVKIRLSETVYDTDGGTGALEVGDFTLSITDGSAELGSANPTAITKDKPTFSSGATLDNNLGGAYGLEIVDLDFDGDMDVVATGLDGDDINWYENDGSENFTERPIVDGDLNGALGLAINDIDGDGDLDIFATAFVGNTVEWYENNGSQNFTQQPSIGTLAAAYDVRVNDLDGDGDMDVIASGRNSNSMVWYKNDGSQSFTENEIDNSIDGPANFDVKDVDGDGDLDLIVAALDANAVVFYQNDGSENFTKNTIDSNLPAARDVIIADIDGDGDYDAAATSSNASGNDLVWYSNDGSGNFDLNVIADDITLTNYLQVADIDGDDDQDILVTMFNARDLIWYENNGSETFTASTIENNLDGIAEVKVADVDGDGDLDAVVTGRNADDVIFYTNSDSGYVLDISLSGTPDGTQTLTISPTSSSIYDIAGNAASTSQSHSTVTLNDLRPTMAITAVNGSSSAVSDGSTTNDATLTVTFTSSASTSNFVVGDITVSGGSLSSFSGSGTTYTATFTPSADGATTIDVAAGAFTDASGYSNAAATQFNWTYDSTAPTITGNSLASNNSTIAVTFSEAVYNSPGGSGSLEADDFVLSISGGSLASTTPSSISASSNTYTLGISLSGTANGSETLTVKPDDDSIYDIAGNEASTSQSNNTATLNGTNYVIDFDGTNDYAYVANSSDFQPNNFSVQAWVNLDAFENEDYLVYRHKTWFIRLSDSGTKIEGGVRDDNGDWLYPKSTTTPTAGGGWYHVVLTFDGTGSSTEYARLYVNGSLQDTESSSNHDLNSQTIKVSIGAKINASNNVSNYFNGQIDDVAFWSEVLTASEITALYNSGTPLDASSNSGNYDSSSGLVAYYKFEQNINSETGSHNGTNSGSSYSQTNIP